MLVAFAVGALGVAGTARADNKTASGTAEFRTSCVGQGCDTASGTVYFFAECAAGSCTVTPGYVFANPCAPGTVDPVSLVLHNVDEGGCANSSNEAPFPVDLLVPGTFVLSQAQWDSLLAGDYVVDISLGPATAGGTILGVTKPKKVIRIPTVSEWGLIVMTIVLLTAGTVVIRRRRGAVSA